VFTFLSDTASEVLDVEELKNAGAYRGNSELPDTERRSVARRGRGGRFEVGTSYYMTSQSHIL
jgi:superfamily II DNA/RNA helicase